MVVTARNAGCGDALTAPEIALTATGLDAESVTRESSTPSRVVMRIRSFVAETMCVVPTAPIVSGGMVVALGNSALNVFTGPGEIPVPKEGVDSAITFENAFTAAGADAALPPLRGLGGGGPGAGISSMSVASCVFGFAFSRAAISLKLIEGKCSMAREAGCTGTRTGGVGWPLTVCVANTRRKRTTVS